MSDGFEEASVGDDGDCALACMRGDIHSLGSNDEGCAGRAKKKSFIALLATLSSVTKNIRASWQTRCDADNEQEDKGAKT